MDKRIASVSYDDGFKAASVWWIEDWDAYSTKESEEDGGNGPYDSAEEAAAALADGLAGKVPEAGLDKFVARCRKHDEEAA